ncbi:phosphate butyryltransferase [Prevotella sp. PCHR]|uniref:Phosphate butyryltransferase n=1 Tax=Xylanibacter caecicola TaxID=2736294 RepID=A0ABX2B4Q5_9BACT|nr:phosphate acyltransferase [Xylanibacter caecicola]NPE25215.1 phosphate butyryltransferase [Xylanibacter caecicola]
MYTTIDFQTLAEQLKTAGTRRRVAVARPGDEHTKEVIMRSLQEGLADFLLVADEQSREAADGIMNISPRHVTVFYEKDDVATARKAVSLVKSGDADVLMKGTLNTDVLLRAVLDKENGIMEKGSVLSHITAAEIPAYKKLLLFSDAAVIPRPTTEQFEAIIRYTTDVFRKISNGIPNVALIHCTEKTSEKFTHTISYAEIMKRAGENAYGNISVGGPMDVKTACDAESGKIKGISSPVAGNADILIFPNIEAGNVFYKTITVFGNALTAGMLCGTTAPVVVASRADSSESKFSSLILACATADKK